MKFTTIDAHTAGEPLRVITSGVPEIPGATILAKRRYAREHLDHIRRALMHEPRGHADMYGCILTEPVSEDGDIGVLFLHNEGYSTMCGHGIIGLVKVGLENGLIAIDGEEPTVRIDTPAGRVTAHATMDGDRVESVSFHNVPSFLFEAKLPVEVDGLGSVTCDLAFGGAFYACVDATSLGVSIDADHASELIDLGMRIKHAVTEQFPVHHPAGDPDLAFVYGTIFVQPADSAAIHSRNVCIFANGEVDRCPTGTGVSARAAVLHARGELPVGETIVIESIIGTTFDVRILSDCRVGDLHAVIPEVTGSAHITGRHEFVVDPDDPLRDGFILR